MLSVRADRRSAQVCGLRAQKGKRRHHGEPERQHVIINPNVKYGNRRFRAAHWLFLYHTPYSFIRDSISAGHFSQRFALVNAMKNDWPFSRGYFPMGNIRPWPAL